MRPVVKSIAPVVWKGEGAGVLFPPRPLAGLGVRLKDESSWRALELDDKTVEVEIALADSPLTDPGERNYRTRLLP